MRQTRAATRAALAKAQQEGMNLFRILDLPPELVEQIFQHLADEDRRMLPTVRLVSRAFAVHCLRPFGTTFFEHVVAMLHPLSLPILLEIASHPVLSKFVQQVTISGERFGGIIDVSGQENGKQLKDLQSSMEKSDMDRLILTEVFRKLPGLAVVRIDHQSFHLDTELMDAARCGSRYLFTEMTRVRWGSPYWESNRVFDVVFTCLRKSGLIHIVDIHLEIHVSTPVSDDLARFSPKSIAWQQEIASKVKVLEIFGKIQSHWTLDLLQSLTNLEELEVSPSDNLLQLSHPTTGLFVWPKLSHFQVDDTKCHAQAIIDFLDAHKRTIQSLYLQKLGFITGTWSDALAIVMMMPQLEELLLSMPYETTPPIQVNDSFDRFSASSDIMLGFFQLSTQAEIRAALIAILEDFRTTSYRSYHANPNTPMYQVDFRRALAIISGRAVVRDGQCFLLADK